MALSETDLANLLTATGTAMGSANQRLAAAGAPALLQQFALSLTFQAGFSVPADDQTLRFTQVARPNAQMMALMKTQSNNVSITATYIAAPGLTPVPPT